MTSWETVSFETIEHLNQPILISFDIGNHLREIHGNAVQLGHSFYKLIPSDPQKNCYKKRSTILTHFQPTFRLRRNQVIGFYLQMFEKHL